MVDPKLHHVLVVLSYLLLLLLSVVQAALGAPVPSTQQGQLGAYHLQLAAASASRAERRFELTVTALSHGEQVQLSGAMLVPASTAHGAAAKSLRPVPLVARREAPGVYEMNVRPLLPSWWSLMLVVQGEMGTVSGTIPLQVEGPSPLCLGQGSEAEAGKGSNGGHGEAPADALWGVQDRRTTVGVQRAVSYLCAWLTLEEAAETFSRLLPLEMSARQTLSLMQPVGEARLCSEDEHVTALWDQAAQARTVLPPASDAKQEPIDRLYIQLDGVLARMRRGSVPMKEKELKRSGDVYREVKVGAVFVPKLRPERSGLAPGVFVDEAGPKHYVARRTTAEEFGKLLYALAVDGGLPRVRQVVILGDGAPWIWRLVAEHFPRAVQIVDL